MRYKKSNDTSKNLTVLFTSIGATFAFGVFLYFFSSILSVAFFLEKINSSTYNFLTLPSLIPMEIAALIMPNNFLALIIFPFLFHFVWIYGLTWWLIIGRKRFIFTFK